MINLIKHSHAPLSFFPRREGDWEVGYIAAGRGGVFNFERGTNERTRDTGSAVDVAG